MKNTIMHKVGEVFDTKDTLIGSEINSYETEIVAILWNKQKEENVYICFDISDGFTRNYKESEMPKITKEMTVEEVSKALGYEVKIIK